jgi:hypothetical protein
MCFGRQRATGGRNNEVLLAMRSRDYEPLVDVELRG